MRLLLIIILGAKLLLTNAVVSVDDGLEKTILRGLLYPRESESRQVRSLDGLWDFAISPSGQTASSINVSLHVDDLSKSTSIMQMPVPSSYNDVTTSRELRDHVGVVWYERTFFVPQSWIEQRVFVYFGSVNYFAQVWINGKFSTNHEFGHLPFEAEITKLLKFGSKNRITVAVDNTLSKNTIPQGRTIKVASENGTRIYIQSYSFDFFNYAGIHRPVLLYTKPRVYLEDITVLSRVKNNEAILEYKAEAGGLSEQEDPAVTCSVLLIQKDEKIVAKHANGHCSGIIKVAKPHLWWPRGMHKQPAYLYTLQVSVSTGNSSESDTYRLPIGIRTVRWTNTSVLINEKAIYLRGFGRHEDSPIRGRGLDLVTSTRDYELLKWIGANSYRTSHYPYSEELVDMADSQGFLIVDECPAVNIEDYSDTLLDNHKASISELIRRDKNHPSVIMWSIANEPRSHLNGTVHHFKEVAAHTKKLDPSRPITAALSIQPDADEAGQFLDVIGFNRYNSWYSNTGRLEVIVDAVITEALDWNAKHDRPVIMFEYGSDTIAGFHELPSYIWSEDYQTDMLSRHFLAFDNLRARGFFIGEFIWNFADFRTAQTYERAGGNKKGIFTRTRDPKMAAHLVRKRYYGLGTELDYAESPEDIDLYIIGNGNLYKQI